MRESEKTSRVFAKSFRRALTKAEAILWSRLRARELNGRKFRRQHPVGPYIADFACMEFKLILEVDGDSHFEAAQIVHDRIRSAYLSENGWRVMRFRNTEIFENLDGVLDEIASAVAGVPPTPVATQPDLPRRRGRRRICPLPIPR